MMTNSEAIQTIREVLMARAQDVLRDKAITALDELQAENARFRDALEIISGMKKWDNLVSNAEIALAALDSLTVEPGGDAKKLVWKIILLWDNAIEPEEYDKAKSKAAALISARDERIRRECKRAVLRQFEECDGTAGDYCLDGKWYIGKWGCDTLDHIMDAIRERVE